MAHTQTQPQILMALKDLGKWTLRQVAAILFVCIAAALFYTLFSWNSADPGWNTATSVDNVQHPLGFRGAQTADFLWTILGVMALAPALFCLREGWLLATHAYPGHTVKRLIFMSLGIILITIGTAVIPVPQQWPFSSGFGGVTGSLLMGLIISVDLEWLSNWIISIITICAGSWLILKGLVMRPNIFNLSLPSIETLRDFMPSFDKSVKSKPKNKIVKRATPSKKKTTSKTAADSTAKTAKRTLLPKVASKISTAESAVHIDSMFQLPSMQLLQVNKRKSVALNKSAQEERATDLGSVLTDFGVKGDIIDYNSGPVVTLFELEPAPGIKSSRVITLADDIARSMSSLSARVAVVPGRNVIGIELPNPKRDMVTLREIIEKPAFLDHDANLPLALGKDIGGKPVIVDLAKMPHLLVAGTTGSGKSVAVNTMILSLLYRLTPEQCRFIMVDPKMLELSIYDDIPHLLTPVVTDPKKAVVALKWAVKEMEQRYQMMSKMGVRNIGGFNQRVVEAAENGEVITRRIQTGFDTQTGKPIFEEQPLPLKPLPFIVVIVDEMADLMLVAGKEIEATIQRLAQMARAAGIHLIMATQRPSVDVITGTIKANFPTRISFQVTSKIDSRTILGEQGAEQLLGQGDMLYMAGGGRISRVHGPFVSDAEVDTVVNFLKSQGTPDYIEEVTIEDEDAAGAEGGEDADPMYTKAVQVVRDSGKISTSYIQRQLQIGYNRAARIVEQMEENGVVSPPNHQGKREIL